MRKYLQESKKNPKPQDLLQAGADSGEKVRKVCDHKYFMISQNPSPGSPKPLQTPFFIPL